MDFEKIKSDLGLVSILGFWHVIRLLLLRIVKRVGPKKVHQYVHSKIVNDLKSYMYVNYSNEISKILKMYRLRDHKVNCQHSFKNPIWVFWLQDERNAPKIVQLCISSIRKYAGDHPVILLNRATLGNYLDIPNHIVEKMEDGIISPTHYSDVIRYMLLYKYKGKIAYRAECKGVDI